MAWKLEADGTGTERARRRFIGVILGRSKLPIRVPGVLGGSCGDHFREAFGIEILTDFLFNGVDDIIFSPNL